MRKAPISFLPNLRMPDARRKRHYLKNANRGRNCFWTPVYYYEMSGQMKTLLDRANPLFSSDYALREIYLLTTAADTDEGTDARAISGLEG